MRSTPSIIITVIMTKAVGQSSTKEKQQRSKERKVVGVSPWGSSICCCVGLALD